MKIVWIYTLNIFHNWYWQEPNEIPKKRKIFENLFFILKISTKITETKSPALMNSTSGPTAITSPVIYKIIFLKKEKKIQSENFKKYFHFDLTSCPSAKSFVYGIEPRYIWRSLPQMFDFWLFKIFFFWIWNFFWNIR